MPPKSSTQKRRSTGSASDETSTSTTPHRQPRLTPRPETNTPVPENITLPPRPSIEDEPIDNMSASSSSLGERSTSPPTPKAFLPSSSRKEKRPRSSVTPRNASSDSMTSEKNGRDKVATETQVGRRRKRPSGNASGAEDDALQRPNEESRSSEPVMGAPGGAGRDASPAAFSPLRHQGSASPISDLGSIKDIDASRTGGTAPQRSRPTQDVERSGGAATDSFSVLDARLRGTIQTLASMRTSQSQIDVQQDPHDPIVVDSDEAPEEPELESPHLSFTAINRSKTKSQKVDEKGKQPVMRGRLPISDLSKEQVGLASYIDSQKDEGNIFPPSKRQRLHAPAPQVRVQVQPLYQTSVLHPPARPPLVAPPLVGFNPLARYEHKNLSFRVCLSKTIIKEYHPALQPHYIRVGLPVFIATCSTLYAAQKIQLSRAFDEYVQIRRGTRHAYGDPGIVTAPEMSWSHDRRRVTKQDLVKGKSGWQSVSVSQSLGDALKAVVTTNKSLGGEYEKVNDHLEKIGWVWELTREYVFWGGMRTDGARTWWDPGTGVEVEVDVVWNSD